ncbi:MAG: phosphoribosyltransferase family protein, partial [Fusobacteriales bacterium]|nr:phosphoribosyltransferase family protein [Fusobacteriales bacterium]
MTGTVMKNYYNILDKLKINLIIKDNSYSIHTDSLFEVGARINPKRSFLFISKIIGKHLRINPDIMFISGKLLGLIYLKEIYFKNEFDHILDNYTAFINGSDTYIHIKNIDLEKKTLFIGFSETATGIAISVFSLFGKNAFFICTTRQKLNNSNSRIEFLEEHSHATDQICYLSKKELDIFDNIVLIDDELTTGNTNLNIISILNRISPGKKYTLISILDWRNKENLKKYKIFSKDNSLEINFVSLIKGNIDIKEDFVFSEDEPGNSSALSSRKTILTKIIEIKINSEILNPRKIVDYNYISKTDKEAKAVTEIIKTSFSSDNSIVIGSGEFIYFPALICKYLSEVNNTEIKYQSFSRSPVLRISDEN